MCMLTRLNFDIEKGNKMLTKLYRLGAKFEKMKLRVISKAIYYLQYLLCNSSVPHSASIGIGTRFAYGGISTVIHGRVVIGKNCIIGQGVTIGGRSRHYDVPQVGDNVYIGAGARLLGPITVGSNSIIAPNAVVIENVEPNTIVGGVPSKVIKRNIKVSDYV